jgi:hypothetical protein
MPAAVPERPDAPAAAVAGLGADVAGKRAGPAGFRYGLLVSTALATVAAWSPPPPPHAVPEPGARASRGDPAPGPGRRWGSLR